MSPRDFTCPRAALRFAACLVPLLLLAAALGSEAAKSQTVSCQASTTSANTTVCVIHEPVVTAHLTELPGIAFKPGDKVIIGAGGCVQTGGHGATWKRYIDPSGDNADHLYHGLVWIPGGTGVTGPGQTGS